VVEEWRDVIGYSRYQVSSEGRVRGPRGLKKATRKPTGYLYVAIDGNRMMVHHLVTESFLGDRPSGLEVRHLDGDPQNNSVSNLAYGTRRENAQDSVAHGTTAKGERHGRHKLTEEQVEVILSAPREVGSGAVLARYFGVSQGCISVIRSGKSWEHKVRGGKKLAQYGRRGAKRGDKFPSQATEDFLLRLCAP
jgi:hypothetical protein